LNRKERCSDKAAARISRMHATPPPHCHPAVFAPVVLLVLLPCAVCLALLLCCLHSRLAHALLGLVDRAQALQWPSASEHRSAFEDFRTDAADRLRCADVSAAWEIPRTRSIRSSSSSRSSTPQSQTQTIFRRSASAPTVPPVPRISCSLRKGTGIQRSSSSAIIDAPYRQATPPTDTKRRKKKLPSSGTAGYCLFYCG
jgi:hypothetical protein